MTMNKLPSSSLYTQPLPSWTQAPQPRTISIPSLSAGVQENAVPSPGFVPKASGGVYDFDLMLHVNFSGGAGGDVSLAFSNAALTNALWQTDLGAPTTPTTVGSGQRFIMASSASGTAPSIRQIGWQTSSLAAGTSQVIALANQNIYTMLLQISGTLTASNASAIYPRISTTFPTSSLIQIASRWTVRPRIKQINDSLSEWF